MDQRSVIKRSVAIALALLVFAGCQSQQFRAREKGALGGAALGAGLGAIVGNQSGDPGAGVAIGSALGAVSGALIGNEIDKTDAQLSARDERIRLQQEQIEENKRLLQALRAGGADARETDRGVVVNLPDVLFEFDSARLTSDARRTTQEIADVLQDVPHRSVAVEGHTDSIGTVAYNQRLSELRARSVADALVAQGLSPRRVLARGLGESDPIASNKTEYGRQRNRRVEVVIEN